MHLTGVFSAVQPLDVDTTYYMYIFTDFVQVKCFNCIRMGYSKFTWGEKTLDIRLETRLMAPLTRYRKF